MRSAIELSEVTELKPLSTLRGQERMKMGETPWWWEESLEVLVLVARLKSRQQLLSLK